jgi:hypothetical protein
MFVYNFEHIFTSVPRAPQNVLISLFGDLVTLFEYRVRLRESMTWGGPASGFIFVPQDLVVGLF